MTVVNKQRRFLSKASRRQINMDIPIHADVVLLRWCRGKIIAHIIVDLVTEQVTHFVVKSRSSWQAICCTHRKDTGIHSQNGYSPLLSQRGCISITSFSMQSHFNGYDAYDSAPPLPSPGMAPSYTMYQPYREGRIRYD